MNEIFSDFTNRKRREHLHISYALRSFSLSLPISRTFCVCIALRNQICCWQTVQTNKSAFAAAVVAAAAGAAATRKL